LEQFSQGFCQCWMSMSPLPHRCGCQFQGNFLSRGHTEHAVLHVLIFMTCTFQIWLVLVNIFSRYWLMWFLLVEFS
jgi:hypothetical protein